MFLPNILQQYLQCCTHQVPSREVSVCKSRMCNNMGDDFYHAIWISQLHNGQLEEICMKKL